MSLTKASFSLINGAVVNVLDYGAKGDNATDDSAAIQAAINAGATIYFPNGKYKVKTPITVPIYKRIIGQNKLDTQIIADAAMDAVIKVGTLTGTNPLKLVALENFAVYGTNLVDTGIIFNTQDSVIRDVYVEGANVTAIHAMRAWSNLFENVKCSYNAGSGMHLDVECNNFDIISCEIDNNDGSGIIVEESLVVSIYGCGLESCGKNGVLIQGARDAYKYNPPFVGTPAAKITVRDCYFENNGRLQSGAEILGEVKVVHGLNPTDAVTHVTVRDCNFNGNNYTNMWVLWLDYDSAHFTWEDCRANAFYTPTLGKAFIGYQGARPDASFVNFKNHGFAGFVKDDVNASKFSAVTYNTNGNVQFNGITLAKQDNGWSEEGDFQYDPATEQLQLTVSSGTVPVQYNLVGTTAQRPSASTGQRYFDTTLGKPIWWDGSDWVDATGAVV